MHVGVPSVIALLWVILVSGCAGNEISPAQEAAAPAPGDSSPVTALYAAPTDVAFITVSDITANIVGPDGRTVRRHLLRLLATLAELVTARRGSRARCRAARRAENDGAAGQRCRLGHFNNSATPTPSSAVRGSRQRHAATTCTCRARNGGAAGQRCRRGHSISSTRRQVAPVAELFLGAAACAAAALVVWAAVRFLVRLLTRP